MPAGHDRHRGVGGRFRFVVGGASGEYVISGEYLVVRPPTRLAFTWTSPTTRGQPTIVSLELEPRGGETLLVLTHSKLPDEEVAGLLSAGHERSQARLAAFLVARAGGGAACGVDDGAGDS